MRYAEVSVYSPIAQRRTFSYSVPPHLDVVAGQAVLVPFGDKLLQGVVLELTPYPAVEETKEIAGILESEPLLSPAQVKLARWLSEYYLSPLFDAVALMLPPGFERKVITFLSSPSISREKDNDSLSPPQRDVLESVRQKDRVALTELEKALGARRVRQAVAELVKQGLLVKTYEMERVKVKPRLVSYLRLKIEPDKAREIAAGLSKRATKQASLLKYLSESPRPVLLSEARNSLNFSPQTVRALVAQGWIEVQQVQVEREPVSYAHIIPSSPLSPTAPQELALNSIKASLQKGTAGGAAPDVFLLHGVTGSGKTEVYLQALAEAVRLGKRGIVLVPEIALTPQTIERFASRFPHRVAVMHSGLSLGEQFDEWRRIKNGEFDAVIGPRSAIFTPQPDLGLIVIDEEHEWTYKQQDKSPRYHARDAALKLAELSGAVVILGSATPDVESFYRAQQGQYRLLELPGRVTPDEGTPMPRVEVVDLRAELKSRNYSLFSRSLSRAIARALEMDEQVILFLNRRGSASFVQCRDCGFVLRCKRCDVPFSYHFSGDALVCHQCNRRSRLPQRCPQCASLRIKFLGVGTEKLEQETGAAFPQARLLRWDSDVTRGKHSHQEILDSFRAGEANLLIGTQMVAKGLDVPGVTLVGVVNADIALNLPDFRAGERTFQVLSQVAGRAGRGKRGGSVILQTYSPEHYAIQAAARHDYLAFYDKEIAYRRELHYPPFSRLARLIYSHTSEAACQQEAERMKRQLIQERDAEGLADIDFIGPAPAYMHKLRSRYRWQLILRGSNLAAFLATIPFPRGWTIDIDPVGLA